MTTSTTPQASDARWMRRALELARLAEGFTRPNPAVGAVIVRDGRAIGEGYHRRAGLPHAEVEALRSAIGDVRGATLYVTLEPCNHTGRTGPCTEAVIAAGIARVVIAQPDPNPVASGGIARLRAAGITVDVGVCEGEARRLNAPFNIFHRERRPLVTLKWAMSADGCTATATAESKWITGEAARARVHEMRAHHDAVLAGAETVRRDDARLSARREGTAFEFAPLRLALSRSADIDPNSAFVRERLGRAVVVCGTAPATVRNALSSAGVELWELPLVEGFVAMHDLMARLHREGIQSLFVEGGRSVAGQFLAHGLVDRVAAFVAPRLIGGGAAHLGGIRLPEPIAAMDAARDLRETSIAVLGSDVLIEGWLNPWIVEVPTA